MKDSEIVYSLTIEDIQKVANEVYGRPLREDEIRRAVPRIEQSIAWFDIVDNAISLVEPVGNA